jgi:hypothetical protein
MHISTITSMPNQMTNGFGFTTKRHEPCRPELDQKSKTYSLSVEYSVHADLNPRSQA